MNIYCFTVTQFPTLPSRSCHKSWHVGQWAGLEEVGGQVPCPRVPEQNGVSPRFAFTFHNLSQDLISQIQTEPHNEKPRNGISCCAWQFSGSETVESVYLCIFQTWNQQTRCMTKLAQPQLKKCHGGETVAPWDCSTHILQYFAHIYQLVKYGALGSCKDCRSFKGSH